MCWCDTYACARLYICTMKFLVHVLFHDWSAIQNKVLSSTSLSCVYHFFSSFSGLNLAICSPGYPEHFSQNVTWSFSDYTVPLDSLHQTSHSLDSCSSFCLFSKVFTLHRFSLSICQWLLECDYLLLFLHPSILYRSTLIIFFIDCFVCLTIHWLSLIFLTAELLIYFK